ncbi:SH3 domain-containing protein [Rhodobacter ferrooxidans]|uniref:SH3 type 3 domain protein n=1 Tax=Rhodobacter ferrooxidans TaxID=371731 RepID=C8S2K9_9RHOB|nr:SH3 domain-containing protein [Rhodobacter sp. SW2]EEW24880.1 SH3 type 3 domain protein [Rhodobacter sp. SW2]
MLRLTLLLCAALFATALIGGRDYGQLRPGLKAAREAALLAQSQPQATPAPAIITPRPAPVIAVRAEAAAPLQMPLVQPVAEAAPEPAPQVWYVNASTVNVRLGPSTETDVLGKLSRGEAATVVAVSGDGWAQIRIEGDGIEGYVAERFLTPDAPAN